jgi:cysteinyl-tRNA synthetase
VSATGGPEAGGAPPRRPWTAIDDWVYWLDGPRLDHIARSDFGLAVIDYSADGSARGEFSASQIQTLRHRGCQRRVVAYLSIGEAEAYRFYWERKWRSRRPAWIVAENPEWRGNYWVRYWDREWQAILFRYLDRILAAGFDGIYLDRVDAYEEPYGAGHEQDMVDLVRALAGYARSRSPLKEDFGVVVQNAEELAAKHPAYVATVTGIAREEVYVRATNRPTSEGARRRAEACLDLVRAGSRGSLVLTVDYADRPDLVAAAYQRARARGYVPYVADVGLDRMRLNPGFPPVCRPFADPARGLP